MQKYFNKLIEEICREQNIKYQYLSKNWIIALEKDNQVKYISGYKFDLNNHALGNILDDKFATYELLKYYDIPVVEHKIIYSSNNKNTYAINCNSIEYVEQYFDLNNKNIVIKPNNSTCGKNVYHIEDRYKIKEILDNLFIDNFSLSMCPYYNIKNEYRAIVLNNKCELAYCKYLPIVIGDGKNSLRSLLIKFNNSLEHELTNNKFDKILKKGEKYKYGWKFNLSNGALGKKIVDKEKLNQIIYMSEKISNKINIGFASIDIIETIDNKFLVLEINSGVMIENYLHQNPNEYKLVKDIFNKAIYSLFKTK